MSEKTINNQSQSQSQSSKKKKKKKGSLSKLVRFILLKTGIAEKTKEEITEEEKRAAIARQQIHELLEINQQWKFVFGEEIPKKKKDIFLIKDVSPRNCWFELEYVFQQIKAYKPDETYHPIDVYALKWQPPDSAHRLIIPLNDPQIQENTLIRIHNMKNKAAQRRIIFFFGPANPAIPIFAPTIHPASLWDFSTRDLVLKKLCDSYLEGKIEAHDFENILINGYDIWKLSVYNLLKEDEQVYHEYLHEKKSKEPTLQDYEKKYYDDEISLQEFADLKFPERKKMREIEQQSYPRPYNIGICIICNGKNGSGLIKCVNCINLVCVNCIHSYFLDENSPNHEGSFLLMHRRFCLKLGKMMQIIPFIAPQPGYLNELRLSGRIAALEQLNPHEKDPYAEEEEVVEDDGEAELALLEEEMRKQKEEEFKKKNIERPPEFDELFEDMEHYEKSYNKLKKNIIIQQHKIEEKGHSDNYYERLYRLKDDDLKKLKNKTGKNIAKIQSKLASLALPGKPSEILLYRMADMLDLIQLLLSMSKAKEFELGEFRILKHEHWYMLSDILPTSLPDHICKVDYDLEAEFNHSDHDEHKHNHDEHYNNKNDEHNNNELDEHKHNNHDRFEAKLHYDQYKDGESAALMLQEAEDKNHQNHQHHHQHKKLEENDIKNLDDKNEHNHIAENKNEIETSQVKQLAKDTYSDSKQVRSINNQAQKKESPAISSNSIKKQNDIAAKANPMMQTLSIQQISVCDLYDTGTVFDKQDPGVSLRIGNHLLRTKRIKEAGTNAIFPESFTDIQLMVDKINEGLEISVEVGNIDAKGNLKHNLGNAKVKLLDIFHENDKWIDITMNLLRDNTMKGEIHMKGFLSSQHELRGVPNIHLYNNMIESKNRSYKEQIKSSWFF